VQTAAHFEELGGNPAKGFLIGGISAGANFSSILSHLARDDKLSPPLTGTYLSIPACMAPELVPEKYKDVYLSREQNKNAPILNNSSMALFESKTCHRSARFATSGQISDIFALQNSTKPIHSHPCALP
jgi:acetyl esterase/lipase